MNLFKQDGPDDVVGAGIEGVTVGVQIGKFVALIFMAIGVVLFHILKFLLPLIIRFLAFLLPILWRLLVQACRWCAKAMAAGVTAMRARLAGNPS